MWTGGKPPRIPQQALKKQDVNSSGVAFRPTGVNAELESLKQRGLAKILNKHFTETAEQLAKEKEAADAALADLERRKANTSEFQASGNGELSPLDSMYVSVNAWRNECRRKERETLLLYQRYVDKFGSTGQVRLPDSYSSTIGSAVGNCGGPASGEGARKRETWIVKDDGSVSSIPIPPASAPPSQLVPTMAAEIERTLDEYIQKGALALPSVEVLGGIEKTFQTTREKEEQEFRNYYRRQLEKRGVDAKSPNKRSLGKKDTFLGPGWVEALGPGVMPRDVLHHDGKLSQQQGTWNNIINGAPRGTYYGTTENDVDEDDDDDDEDDEIVMLDENIPFNSASVGDDDSVVSGLTSIHSHITRSVIQDCERSVYEFLKEEKSQIHKLLQQEEKADAAIRAGNVKATKATEEAENMVKQMENILMEYQMKHADDSSVSNKQHEARRYPTDNPEEVWMVYYDEFYQQEYYHECNSNRTQWDPPGKEGANGKDASSTSASGTGSDNTVAASSAHDLASVASSHAILLSSEDVMPENGRRGLLGGKSRAAYESRISQYRRKRKRERKRKIIASFFVLIAVAVATVTYCVKYRPELVETVTQTVESYLDEYYYKTAVVETQSRSVVVEAPIKAVDINPFAFEFEHDVIVRALDIIPYNKYMMSSCERDEMEAAFAAAKAAKEAERLRKLEDERQRKEMLRRPWACNIPFAYLVHSRCNRLAKQSPLFNLQELILSLLL